MFSQTFQGDVSFLNSENVYCYRDDYLNSKLKALPKVTKSCNYNNDKKIYQKIER